MLHQKVQWGWAGQCTSVSHSASHQKVAPLNPQDALSEAATVLSWCSATIITGMGFLQVSNRSSISIVPWYNQHPQGTWRACREAILYREHYQTLIPSIHERKPVSFKIISIWIFWNQLSCIVPLA